MSTCGALFKASGAICPLLYLAGSAVCMGPKSTKIRMGFEESLMLLPAHLWSVPFGTIPTFTQYHPLPVWVVHTAFHPLRLVFSSIFTQSIVPAPC